MNVSDAVGSKGIVIPSTCEPLRLRSQVEKQEDAIMTQEAEMTEDPARFRRFQWVRIWYPILNLGLFTGIVLAQNVKLPPMTQLKESHTFRAAKLTPTEQKQIFKQIEAISFDTPSCWESELRVRRVPLGGPQEGLVLQGSELLCGGTGNCQTFVLRRERDKWIPMFQKEAPIADGFGFSQEGSHGFKDFVIEVNTSAESGTYVIYKSDGKYYRASLCYEKDKVQTKPIFCK
jgi:hypothetical protein